MEALAYISENLRDPDQAEVVATLGRDIDPLEGIIESWQGSDKTWLVTDPEGLPVGVFGVAPHMVPGVGIAWLLGTDGIVDHRISFLRQTDEYVEELHKLYPILWANVDARNEVSVRWIEKAGFHLEDADPEFGPEQQLFLQYVRTR